VSKKEVDKFQGMLPDEVIAKCISKRFINVKEWVVLPFLNVSGDAILITRRSETARKAIVLLDNKQLIFIKEIPWYCSSKDFVVYQTQMLKSLYENGSKVPKIIPSIEGALFTILDYGLGESFLLVQDFIVGETWNGSLTEALKASHQLAILHEQMEHYYKKNESIYYPVSNSFSKSLEMLKVALDSINEKGVSNICDFDSYYKYAVDKIESFRDEAYREGYSDILFPIHGDFNPWNLVFTNDKEVKSILDFDNSALSNPIRDVVEMILVFCVFKYKKNSTRFETAPSFFDISLALAMIKEYFKNSDYKFYDLMPPLASTVCIELIALAVARYDFVEYTDLYKIDTMIYESFMDIIKEIKKND